MIDLTTKPVKRYEAHVCRYCDHDKYPAGKNIDDYHKTSRSDWILLDDILI